MRHIDKSADTLKGYPFFFICIFVAVFMFFIALPGRTLAATIVVNSTDDTAVASDGKCTLREAINNANSNTDTTSGDCTAGSGADTITFSVSGTITLGSTLPTVNSADGLTIDGGEHITISGNSSVRVLIVDSPGVLTLENLTVEDGNAGSPGSGGGILNNGILTLTNSIFSLNHATQGGAILNNNLGILTVTSSIFSFNQAIAHVPAFPGDIEVPGLGGAIDNSGKLAITDSSFDSNAGISGVELNAAAGGIFNSATMTVTNSTFSRNLADAAGAIFNVGKLTITNSTFGGSVLEFQGNISGSSPGGAIFNGGGALAIINSTFSGNIAGHTLDGGAINNDIGTVTLTNTIVVNSINTSSPPSSIGNCSGTITDGGFNIDDDGSCVSASTSQTTNPQLDPAGLKDNGGPTQTIALCTGAGTPTGCTVISPAIDAVQTGCPPPSTDQRGVSRPQDGNNDGTALCDIGAFEVIGNIIIGGCNTGVLDQLLGNGGDISGQINECAAIAKNHGQFVSCVSHLTNSLEKAGIIKGKQKGAIQSCTGRANIP